MNRRSILERLFLLRPDKTLITSHMPILQTSHASDILPRVQIISVEHLLYRVDPLRQKTAMTIVLSLAVLAEHADWSFAFVYYVAPLVALVADCALWAFLAQVAH